MNRGEEQRKVIEEKVKEALRRYREDVMDTNAGYDILRFARQGYLKDNVE